MFNKKTWYKIIFIGLLTAVLSGSNYTKCGSLSNQKCMPQPIFINVHPNEYSQELHYYPYYPFNFDRYVPNKTEDLNLSMFNMITGINE